jgi:hypothetical protein
MQPTLENTTQIPHVYTDALEPKYERRNETYLRKSSMEKRVWARSIEIYTGDRESERSHRGCEESNK